MIFFLCGYSHHGTVRSIYPPYSMLCFHAPSLSRSHSFTAYRSSHFLSPKSCSELHILSRKITSQLYPSTAFSCIKPRFYTATRYSFNKNLGILGKIEFFSFKSQPLLPQVHYFATSAEVCIISTVHMDNSVGL